MTMIKFLLDRFWDFGMVYVAIWIHERREIRKENRANGGPPINWAPNRFVAAITRRERTAVRRLGAIIKRKKKSR